MCPPGLLDLGERAVDLPEQQGRRDDPDGESNQPVPRRVGQLERYRQDEQAPDADTDHCQHPAHLAILMVDGTLDWAFAGIGAWRRVEEQLTRAS
jgi:hypothetical protein